MHNLPSLCVILVFVVAVSEPKLSVVPPVDDGVTLQCEANCWFPEPEITFLDNQGNDISAENSYTDRDSSGCFNAKRSLTLQTHTKRFDFSLILNKFISGSIFESVMLYLYLSQGRYRFSPICASVCWLNFLKSLILC